MSRTQPVLTLPCPPGWAEQTGPDHSTDTVGPGPPQPVPVSDPVEPSPPDPNIPLPSSSLGYNLVDDIHTGFVDVLRHLSDRPHVPVPETPPVPVHQHPLYQTLMAHVGTHTAPTHTNAPAPPAERQPLVLVPRHHEEAYMRPPTSDEVACAEGPRCEGHAVATAYAAAADDTVRVPNGYTLVALTAPGGTPTWTRCVWCLRKETSLAWYRAKAEGTVPDTLAQPYRNAVDVPGEYSRSACLWPGDKAPWGGIVAPFVRHERHQYVPVWSTGDALPRWVHRDTVVVVPVDDAAAPPPLPPLYDFFPSAPRRQQQQTASPPTDAADAAAVGLPMPPTPGGHPPSDGSTSTTLSPRSNFVPSFTPPVPRCLCSTL